MCQGQPLPDSPRPEPSLLAARARLLAANAELEASRERLARAVAQLARERARAREIRRRLEESYAERERLKRIASVMDIIHEGLKRRKLQLKEEAAASKGGKAPG